MPNEVTYTASKRQSQDSIPGRLIIAALTLLHLKGLSVRWGFPGKVHPVIPVPTFRQPLTGGLRLLCKF